MTVIRLVCHSRAAPQDYQSHRGIMDEALKKFYFDLYDGETDGLKTGGREPEPQSHSFNIDDYFDVDSSTNNNNDKAKQENNVFVPPSISDRSTIFQKPKQNNFASTPTTAKPSSSASFQQAVARPASPEGGRDPTFVLSRLLFHLSQLPQL